MHSRVPNNRGGLDIVIIINNRGGGVEIIGGLDDYSGLESTCFYKVTTLCFNVYQIYILNVVLMCKIPTRTALSVFYPCFVRLSHSYPTILLESYYLLPSHTCVNV